MLWVIALLTAQAGLPVTEENSHRWTAPEWSPWEMSRLGGRELGKAEKPIVFRSRAIVPHAGGVLWLTRRNDRWGYVGWRSALNISKDWLYQGQKTGTLAMPEHAADAYLKAVYDNKPGKAEVQCTQRAWSFGKFPLETIFTNTRKGEAHLRRLALSQRNRRAYVLVKILQRSVVKGEFYLTLSKRGAGWLIDGVAEEQPDITARVLFPATAQLLRDELTFAFLNRAAWRIPKLALGTFREELLEIYTKGGPPEGTLQVDGNRATFGRFAFMRHRAGWRVTGVTK